MAVVEENLQKHLQRFGLNQFRPGQREVIEAIVQRRDCLCIMPTGGGKSLCFQLPAVMRAGVAIVISPLIALMKDQVDSLSEQGLSATFVNSALSVGEQRQRIDRMVRGEYDLVYIAPERLRNQYFRDALRDTEVQLLAVDEVHCISQWGHDFRTDYSRLGEFRERLGNPQTIALTATATPEVREDVLVQLGLSDPAVFITGFARPNLRFEALHPDSQPQKQKLLVKLLAQAEGPAIVYVSTRKACEEIVDLVTDKFPGSVALYHAGLEADERRDVQEAFMSGDIGVIAATNAFGMGIDKADLRMVVHYNMPGSLEAYYQEAGRAGRDGQPARCVMLFSYADRFIQQFFIENRYPPAEAVQRIYDYLRRQERDPIEMTLQELKETLRLSIGAEGVGAAEKLLADAGAIRRLDSQQNKASVWLDSDLPSLVDLLPKEARTQRKVLRGLEEIVGRRRSQQVCFHLPELISRTELEKESVTRALREITKLPQVDYVPAFRGRAVHVVDRDREFHSLDIDFVEINRRKQAELDKLEQVIRYSCGNSCRQRFILGYFGEPGAVDCGFCDQCNNSGRAMLPSHEVFVVDETIELVFRKVLSGVARAKQRYGKLLIAQMLCGSKNVKMSRFGLDKLSTFGLLAELKQNDVSWLIDEMVRVGLLEQVDVDRFRPVVKLTAHGDAVMRGQRKAVGDIHLPSEMRMKLGLRRTAPPPPTESLSAEAGELLQALWLWREETAQELGWAPFRLLHNATLERIADVHPLDLTALAGVKGIGPSTISTWGEQIVAICQTGADDHQHPSPSNSTTAAKQPAPPATGDSTVDGAATADSPSVPATADEREVSEREVSEREVSEREVAEREVAEPTFSEAVDEQERTGAAWDFRFDSASAAVLDPLDGADSPTDGPATAEADVEPTAAEVDDAMWTWRLLRDGYGADDCRRIRGLEADAVTRHLLIAHRAGREVELRWVCDEADIAALERASERSLVDGLPAHLTADHLRLFSQLHDEQRAGRGDAEPPAEEAGS